MRREEFGRRVRFSAVGQLLSLAGKLLLPGDALDLLAGRAGQGYDGALIDIAVIHLAIITRVALHYVRRVHDHSTIVLLE